MQRRPVSSSRISSVGWEANTLEIEFKNGSVYQYFEVNEFEYRNFMNSDSLGKELSNLDKVHRYTKIR